MKEKRPELGKKMKELRIGTGLTQAALGELLGVTGAAWRQYELGLRMPNDQMKKKISVYFKQTVDELFF